MRSQRESTPGPEGLLRDSRRGSWVMIVPARDFIERLPVVERRQVRRTEPDDRIFSSEIYAVLALAGLLSYMFWTISHT